MPKWTLNSPPLICGCSTTAGWLETKESAPAASVVVEAGEDRFVGTELPRFDSAGGGEEELEEEHPVRFDPCGEDLLDGDKLGKHGGYGESSGGRESTRSGYFGRKWGGKREGSRW